MGTRNANKAISIDHPVFKDRDFWYENGCIENVGMYMERIQKASERLEEVLLRPMPTDVAWIDHEIWLIDWDVNRIQHNQKMVKQVVANFWEMLAYRVELWESRH